MPLQGLEPGHRRQRPVRNAKLQDRRGLPPGCRRPRPGAVAHPEDDAVLRRLDAASRGERAARGEAAAEGEEKGRGYLSLTSSRSISPRPFSPARTAYREWA